jgi:hypothetical protein
MPEQVDARLDRAAEVIAAADALSTIERRLHARR